ncbi:hypothetical protein ACW7G2_13860 [Luteimonas sp. A277]
MFSKIAILINRKPVRLALAAVWFGCTLLLGHFVVVLLVVGYTEPRLFSLGLGGVAGLLGAFFRIGAGPRFFLLTKWERGGIATCIASGIGAAFFAKTALPENVYWATLIPGVGLLGLFLLTGSIKGSAEGPNNSFKPKPLRGSA